MDGKWIAVARLKKLERWLLTGYKSETTTIEDKTEIKSIKLTEEEILKFSKEIEHLKSLQYP